MVLPFESIVTLGVLLVSNTKLLASLVPKVAVVPKELPPCTNALVPVGAIKEAVRAFIAFDALSAQLAVILYVPTGRKDAVSALEALIDLRALEALCAQEDVI